jgi:hypothetical protein
MARVVSPASWVSRDTYIAWTAALKRLRSAHRRRMSAEQREAVDLYTNMREPGAGMRLNEVIRAGERRRVTSALDAAIRSSRMSLPSNVPFPPVLFRGVSGAGARHIARFAEGARVRMDGYLSTTFMPFQAMLYAGRPCCLLELRFGGTVTQPMPQDCPCVYSPDEDEIVLPRGTTWVYVGRRMWTPATDDPSLLHPTMPVDWTSRWTARLVSRPIRIITLVFISSV